MAHLALAALLLLLEQPCQLVQLRVEARQPAQLHALPLAGVEAHIFGALESVNPSARVLDHLVVTCDLARGRVRFAPPAR